MCIRDRRERERERERLTDLLQCIPCDEVHIINPQFGSGVPMLINLLHDSAQVHGILDDLIVVWHLDREVKPTSCTSLSLSLFLSHTHTHTMCAAHTMYDACEYSHVTTQSSTFYLFGINRFGKLLELSLRQQLVGGIPEEHSELT